MFAGVYRLRTLGAVNGGQPPVQSQWTRGILEFSTAAGDGVRSVSRRLVLRHAMANPTKGIIFELYRPELLDVRDQCLCVRGIEPAEAPGGTLNAVLQEWLIVVNPVPQG